MEVYRAKGHSCFLYLGSILVDEYGSDCSNWDIILYMMNAFIEPTYSLLQNENCYREHPDTIDDLFRLCSRFVDIVFCNILFIILYHKEGMALSEIRTQIYSDIIKL